MEDYQQKHQELSSMSLKELLQYAKSQKVDLKNCLEKSEIISLLVHSAPLPPGPTFAVSCKQLECPLCLDLLCEPITTLCGHTFCRTCLVQALQQCRHVCPQCRESCHIDAKLVAQTVLLANLIQMGFEKEYERRLEQCELVKKDWDYELPIFFYNQVLFPTSLLSLHLFEDRYKKMIKRVMENNRQFIYLPNFQNYKANKGEIGLIMHVDDCQFLHDGRSLIKCTAIGRGIINKNWIEDGSQGLAYCSYSSYNDTNSKFSEEESQKIKTETIDFLASLKSQELFQNYLLQRQSEPSINQVEKWSFYISSIVYEILQNNQWGMQIIQIQDSTERLKMVNDILKQVFDTIEKKKNQPPQQQNVIIIQLKDSDSEIIEDESNGESQEP